MSTASARIVVPSLLLLAAAIARVSHIGRVEILQEYVFDQYQARRPRPYVDAGVRVVDIDDESLRRLGQWPWPRTLEARLVARLTELGAKTVAFDFLFAEPDRTSPDQVVKLWPKTKSLEAVRAAARRLPSHDRLFAQAVAKSTVVTSFMLTDASNAAEPALKVRFAYPGPLEDFAGALPNLPEIERAAAGNGHISFRPDRDGVIRQAPLLARFAGTVAPSFVVEALRTALRAPGVEVESGARGVAALRIGALRVPTDARARFRIRYSGDAPHTVAAWCVLEPGCLGKEMSGAIVFVGSSATGLNDFLPTPLSPRTPGIEVHAQAAEAMLRGEFLSRPPWADRAELACLLALGAGLIVAAPLLGPLWSGLAALAAIAAAFGLSWFLFATAGLLLDPLFPAATALAVYLSSALIGFARSEAERRRLALLDVVKDEFVAMVSHDLRGPVGAMVMATDVLLSGAFGPLTDKQTKSLRLIKESGRKLVAFVGNVLDAAKIKAGKLELSKQELRAQEVLAGLVELFAVNASAKGISLEQRAPADLPPVYADREKLEQVINNLVGNAMKFTPERGRVTLEAREEERFVRFSVSDTGAGIAPEDVGKLFARFQQVDLARQRELNAVGTGLGLNICKTVVEAHGGRIWVESLPGKGSSFHFTIPRYRP